MFCKRKTRCIFFIIALLFVQITMGFAQPRMVAKWAVEKKSSLHVQGTSNVNSFTCSINEYSRKDTITCFETAGRPISLSGEIQMDILSFSCHSSMMTSGLRQTLKANDYPTMKIRFLSIECMPVMQNKIELIKGWIEVQLAGCIKKFELTYSFLQMGSGHLQLNGIRRFRFSDFHLAAPRKFGGLIKIKDDFEVHFQLALTTI